MDKHSYISPSKGELTISVRRDQHPEVAVSIDLGIPNFTVFQLKFPLALEDPNTMGDLVWAALRVLLDDVSAFMLSLGFPKDVAVDVYARVLACFQVMNAGNSDTDTNLKSEENGASNVIKTYEGEFELPMTFVQTTQEKIITGAAIVNRRPAVRELKLVQLRPNQPQISDAARVIRMYRNRILRHQPSPLYVLVYDQKGRPVGVQQVKPTGLLVGGR